MRLLVCFRLGAQVGKTVDQFLQHIANALILGGTYALLGIGLTLILGVMKVVNFTHGELYAFGGFMAYYFVSHLGWNFFIALPTAIMLGILLGALIERLVLRSMRGADIDSTMVAMIGCWIALQNISLLIWGGVAKSVSTPFPTEPLMIGSVAVSWLRLFVLVAAIGLIIASYVLLQRTSLGKAMRATFQDSSTASLVTTTMGNLAALKAFSIVILGGLGSVPGAMIGGFILAFAEELGSGYISSGYRDAVGFILIILVLMFRPTGLFKPRGERIG